MKKEKEYTILIKKNGKVMTAAVGTLDYLINGYFGYTLECGQSWEHEDGNHKINTNPKSIATLVKNLNWATNNSAQNGYSGTHYELG